MADREAQSGARITESRMDGGHQPEETRKERTRVLLPAVLFVVTVVTTVIAGALYDGADILKDPSLIARGVPFSA